MFPSAREPADRPTWLFRAFTDLGYSLSARKSSETPLVRPTRDVTKGVPNKVWMNILSFVSERNFIMRSGPLVSRLFYSLIASYRCRNDICRVRTVCVFAENGVFGLDDHGRMLCQPHNLSTVLSRPSTLCHGFNIIGSQWISPVVEDIEDALMNGVTIHRLGLTDFYISYDSIVRLMGAISIHGGVRSLRLCNNNFSVRSVMYIAEMIRVNTTIRTLVIEDNTIGNAGAIQLANALKSNENTTLRSLSLINCGLQKDGILSIADMLATNTTLTSFEMTKCILGSFIDANFFGGHEGFRIIRALGENTTLRHVSLRDCTLDNNGTNQLAEVLVRKTSLCSINLSNCTRVSYRRFFDILSRVERPISINMRHCLRTAAFLIPSYGEDEEYVGKIIQLMRTNKKIAEIDVTNINCSSRSKNLLRESDHRIVV